MIRPPYEPASKLVAARKVPLRFGPLREARTLHWPARAISTPFRRHWFDMEMEGVENCQPTRTIASLELYGIIVAARETEAVYLATVGVVVGGGALRSTNSWSLRPLLMSQDGVVLDVENDA